jgi:hypothetical protein
VGDSGKVGNGRLLITLFYVAVKNWCRKEFMAHPLIPIQDYSNNKPIDVLGTSRDLNINN